MTKEEREKAIDLLDNLLGMVEDNQDNDYDKALKIGIESLRKEPSEDCVSRKQAIDFVNEVIGGKNDFANAIRDGVEAVLSALPPVTPTISEIDKFNDSVNRATVLNLINDVKNADGFKDYSQYEYLFDQVDKMPMATPTRRKEKNESSSENPNKWIPCSERLPEERKAVLVYCPERKNIYCACYENEQWWIFGAYFEKIEFEVVAWQHLPKPYKETESEQLLSYADQDTMQPAT